MEELNTLVANNTAFFSYTDLAKAMATNGYTPSLRRDRKGPKALIWNDPSSLVATCMSISLFVR